MASLRWLTCERADVPLGDAWLGPAERRVQERLVIERRREDWRLGRWTAKTAVSVLLGVRPEEVAILAAADGAPEAWIAGEPAGVSVSLSHRGGRGLAAAIRAPLVVGCDLELIEPRSNGFLADWLAPAERALVAATPASQRELFANLVWTAKEAAAKVRREGLRLDLRSAVTKLAGHAGPDGLWRPLAVRWDGHESTAGWWRAEPGWVMTIAAEPACPAPQPL